MGKKPIFSQKKPPVISTIIVNNTLWKNAKKIITQNNVQIVHCRSYISALIGLKGSSQYHAQIVANRSPQPMEYFIIDPLDYLEFVSKYTPLFIFHSHPHTESSFSEVDKAGSEGACIPFIMFSVQDNKFALYVPENHELDVNTLNKVKGLI